MERTTAHEPGARSAAWSAVAGRAVPRAQIRDTLVSATLATPLGSMVGVAADERVVLLEFADRRTLPAQVRHLERRFGRDVRPGSATVLDRLAAELDEYFAGQRRTFDAPIGLRGSAWQEACWAVLGSVPFGATISYREGAALAGRPGSARAFGRANGDNCLAILVPCHRVVGSDGSLTGYAGGFWRKQALLELERG